MANQSAFGPWLRHQRREVLGLKQIELASRVSCSETMIRKVEKGERRPAKELAERLIRELGIGTEEIAVYVAWARGLTGHPEAGGIELSDGVQHVLVPLDAVASFGQESPTIVTLTEPYMGRVQWVPVPLSLVTTFGLQPPCVEEACNGQDPEMLGCARGSETVDGREIVDPQTGAVVGMLELRYSRSCQTNWARVTRLCRDGRHLRAYLRDESGSIIEVTQAEAESPRVLVYGPMWYAPTGKVRVQACGVIEGYDEVCTGLH